MEVARDWMRQTAYFLSSSVDSLDSLVLLEVSFFGIQFCGAEPRHLLGLERLGVVAEVLLELLGLVLVPLVEAERLLVGSGDGDRVLSDFFSAMFLFLESSELTAMIFE